MVPVMFLFFIFSFLIGYLIGILGQDAGVAKGVARAGRVQEGVAAWLSRCLPRWGPLAGLVEK